MICITLTKLNYTLCINFRSTSYSMKSYWKISPKIWRRKIWTKEDTWLRRKIYRNWKSEKKENLDQRSDLPNFPTSWLRRKISREKIWTTKSELPDFLTTLTEDNAIAAATPTWHYGDRRRQNPMRKQLISLRRVFFISFAVNVFQLFAQTEV